MTDIAALKALLEKVKAGEWLAAGDSDDVWLNVFDAGLREWHGEIFRAFRGDVNAAIAFHEAVRPGYDAQISICERPSATIFEPIEDEWEEVASAEAENPARALLIADIESIIAERE